MAEPTGNERGHDGGDLAAAARERGMEQLETAKAQLAEGAERVAAAVERTAEELDGGGGDEGISGFGRSAATLMRQLAGGLRERDVEEFAHELGTLARRNPGLFLAGSVALGFGIARFFKARSPRSEPGGGYGESGGRYGESGGGYGWRESEEWRSPTRSSAGEPHDFDPDESLDLSANSLDRSETDESVQAAAEATRGDATTRREDERSRARGRQGGRQRGKGQRASAGSPEQSPDASAAERPSMDGTTPTPSTDSAASGGTGSGPSRGDKP